MSGWLAPEGTAPTHHTITLITEYDDYARQPSDKTKFLKDIYPFIVEGERTPLQTHVAIPIFSTKTPKLC